MAKVDVDFKFMENGWQYQKRSLEEAEVSALLEGATVVSSEFSGWSSQTSLNGTTLKLKDGRKCVLTEEHESSWEGSSVGWIHIFITEEW